MSDQREIKGLENIVSNSRGMLHHIHAPGEDGPDDPGASPFWKTEVRTLADYPDALPFMADYPGSPSYTIITSPIIRARYAAALERLARERNEAAYEWTRLRWWQWRKRKRLWRMLFADAGWRAIGVEGVPERVTRCGRFIKRYREGGC